MECVSKIFDSDYLKEILEFIFAYQNNYNKFLIIDKKKDFDYNYFYVSTKNYHLLKWYFTKKYNISEKIILKGIPDISLEILKEEKKIPNIISLKIFENISNHLISLGYKKEEIEKFFFKAGYYSSKKFLKNNFKFLSLLNGRKVWDIVDSLEFVNYKYNNTKFFKFKKSKIEEDLYQISVKVTPIYGIINSRAIIEWNCGIYKSYLELSKEKIIDQYYRINIDGSWEYFVKYIRKKRNRTYNFLKKKFIDYSHKEYLELAEKQNLIVLSSKLKLENLFFVQELIDNNHLPSGDHNNDVTFVALKFGKDLGLSLEELEILGKMAFLHDLGKSAIPHEIISKPGRFEGIEYNVMKSHAIIGFSLALSLGFSLQESVGTLEHHFRADGSGYEKVDWKRTSKFGLILQIVDVYCALMVKRSYKKGVKDSCNSWNKEKVKSIIREELNKNKFYKDYAEFFLNETFESLEKVLNDSKSIAKRKLIGYFKDIDDSYAVSKFQGTHPQTKIFVKNRYEALLFILKYFLNLSKTVFGSNYFNFPHVRNKFILEKRKLEKILDDKNLDLEKIHSKLSYDLSDFFPLKVSKNKIINSFDEYLIFLKEEVL